jgi:hypothetical protein
MKKILSIFILFGILMINACDPMEDIYDEIDAKGDVVVSSIEFVLTADDYASIAELAVKANPNDTVNADFISTFEYFTNEIQPQDYVALLLNDVYKVSGPGSTAKVTFNYNDDIPENLSNYIEIDGYTFDADDYSSVDSLVNITGYFYPAFNPDLYIPDVLTNSIADAVNGDMQLVSYKYSDVNPVITIVNNTKFFEEDFETATAYETIDINNWSQFQEAGAETWEGRSYSGNTYAQFSAFGSGEASNIGWLISPAVDLTEYSEVILNFESKDGYSNGDPLTVLISTDYNGTGDPTSSTWVNLSPTLSTGNTSGYASTWVESGDISLDTYTGGTVYIAFKYEGGDPTLTTTMQIDNVTFTALTAGFDVVGTNAYTANDYYEFDGSEWSKISNVHYLNSVDYDNMGTGPGKYNNFSATDLPQDYIPKFLDNLYPTAGEGISAVVVYKYYTGTSAGTITLADNYTYTAGAWVSSYAYVQEMTAQWAVSSSTNKWVFDPTETITMVPDDYKLIVEYVKANHAADDASTYDDSEYYFGASYYYNNFDLRNFNATVFDSWEEALEEALGTVLLPELYPSATLQVNGVDMFYRVVFATYSGANAKYAMKFQVTKAGPDPEFTLVEGPTLQ